VIGIALIYATDCLEEICMGAVGSLKRVSAKVGTSLLIVCGKPGGKSEHKLSFVSWGV
jgi:hypothetical protein